MTRGGLRAMKALYYGDNLQVLREGIATESVDLIYLDPALNSNAAFNVGNRVPAVVAPVSPARRSAALRRRSVGRRGKAG